MCKEDAIQGSGIWWSCCLYSLCRKIVLFAFCSGFVFISQLSLPFYSYPYITLKHTWQFSPDSSVGKESTCNAGVPSSIPGSGCSTGERIDYPLQYSWASLVAQLLKNLPAMRETWVRALGWEDALEKAKATHSSILAWRIPQTV